MSNDYFVQIPPGMLLRAISGKRDAIAYYEKLASMAAEPGDRKIIEGITFEERAHLELMLQLFAALYGKLSEETLPRIPEIESFQAGVRAAIMNELDNYSFFGNIIFTDGTAEVRDTFFRVAYDEIAHSSKYNFILTNLNGR